MSVLWQRKIKHAADENLLGRVGNMVLSPYYVGYFHQQVVNHDGKIIKRQEFAGSTRLSQTEIAAKRIGVKANFAADKIGKTNIGAGRDFQADYGRLFLQTFFRVLTQKFSELADVGWIFLFATLLLIFLF